MAARIRWTASIVASVPELANRHSGWPKRSRRFSATTIASSVGWAKWVPWVHPLLDRRDDRGVGVADDGDAVPAVEVAVLAAVDVVQLRAFAVAHPDGLRLGDLPVRGGTAGQSPGAIAERAALRLAGDERRVSSSMTASSWWDSRVAVPVIGAPPRH